MADYSKLKSIHPRAKVGNIKRLIAAIRRSGNVQNLDSWILMHGNGRMGRFRFKYDTAFSQPRFEYSANLSGRGDDRVGFSMDHWIQTCKLEKGGDCGTWACIAGFAHILDTGGDSTAGIKSWVSYFAEFTGLLDDDEVTAFSICHPPTMDCDVRPRHAVRLLEILLETGELDWERAMGTNPRTGRLTREEATMQKREKREMDELMAA